MNMNYKTLKDKSIILSKKLGAKNNNDTEEPENIDDLEIDKCVLILGLNPSSAEFKNDNEEKANCFLKYIPEDNLNDEQKGIIEKLSKKMYIYNRYFKRNYELFDNHSDFNMLWQNPNYLKRYKKLLKNEWAFLNLDNFKPKIKKYIVFSDLVFIKNKMAKKIESKLENNNLKIKELFDLQLDYYKPSLVIVTNAAASNLLNNLLNNGKDVSEMIYRSIPIIFSSMVSGQRALDKFNFIRLKKDIEKHLNDI